MENTLYDWKLKENDFIIECVNGIQLCNEESLEYDCYYLSVSTPIIADWSSLDTYDVLDLLPDDTVVVSSWYSEPEPEPEPWAVT